MNMRKFYKKYGKRTLAAFLSVLLLVQTPLLSYADNIDNAISSYDDVAERPVWDDSYSMDDTEEFDSSIIGAGANRIEDINDLELEPLSNEQIEYLMEHENDEIAIPQIATSSNADPLNHDDEIEPQIAVAVTTAAIACVAIMAYAGMSALTYKYGQTIVDKIKKVSEASDSETFKFDYFVGSSVKTAFFTAALAKQFLDKLNNSSGKSITLTNSDKEILFYAFTYGRTYNDYLITPVNPKNVNIHPVDGYKYYYILVDNVRFTSSTVYVLYTTNPVAFATYKIANSRIRNKFYFYNALLKDQTYPYSESSYYVGTYDLSDATGLYEFSSGLKYDPSKESFGAYDWTAISCMPFPVFHSDSNDSKFPTFENYFTIGSPLILDLSIKERMTNTDSLFGLGSVDCSNVSDYIGSKKNTFGLTSALNPGAGLITDTGNTGSGNADAYSATKQYSRLFYVLRALADKYKISITSAQFNEFIASFYKKYINGTSAEAPDQSKEIMDKFVVINGGKTPNDNNDDNKYNLKKRLVDGFFSFCITAGLITSAPDYSKDTNVKSNVSIDNSDDSSTGGGTNPGGGTNTGGNTSTGSSTDLSGVLEYLKNILSILGVLNAWQNPLSLIDTLVSKLGLENIVTAINNIGNNVASALGLDDLFDSLELPTHFNDLFDILNSWNFANMFSGQTNSLLDPLNNIEYGINTFWNQFIENFNSIGFKDLLTNISRIIEDLPGKLVLGFASSELFSGIGTNIANMPLYLANLLGLGTTTLPNLFNNVVESIKAIPGEIGKIIPPSSGNDNVDDGESINDSGFKNFLNLFMLTLLIIVLLIILFMNCLRFIVLVFNIPASTALMPADMLKGIEFMKNLQLPLFGVSLYSLLLSCAYFVIFMTIIMTIRRKIDKLHI